MPLHFDNGHEIFLGKDKKTLKYSISPDFMAFQYK